MKVYSDKKPPAFFYHVLPRNNRIVMVRFCDNPVETESGWEYDEYTVEIEHQPNIDEHIKTNYIELHTKALGWDVIAQKMYANLDYISMMSGIDIPTEEGANNGGT